jgi:hypothetical protein
MTIKYAKVRYSERFGLSAYVDDGRTPVSAEAKETRRRMIAALSDRRDRGYKQKLAACGPNRESWCNLSMCSCCVERAQRWLTTGAAECPLTIFSEHEVPIIAIQADLPVQRYERLDLCDIDLPALNQQIQRQYAEAGISLAFSGVRVSLIEDKYADTEFWAADVRSVIVGLPKRNVIQAIKSFYPRQPVEKWRDLDAEQALQSTIESGFFQEITFKNDDGCRVTRSDQLWGTELRRVAYCFARYRMAARYVLTGCHVIDDGLELNRGVKKRLQASADKRRRGS